MIAIVPVLAIILGALVYGLATNGKVQELGRLTFGAGMLVWIFQLASRTVELFSR